MTTHAACPLCGTRRARRPCPALDRQICPVCCGTKRLVEIRCPADCSFLATSRAHPAAVVQRRQERDVRFLLPFTSDLSEPQYRLLLFFQAVVARHRPAASPPLRDEDAAAAAEALAATFETARKGLIYEHQAAALPAQQLMLAMKRAFTDALGDAAADSRLERDAAVALRRLEGAARSAATALDGDEAPVYLNLVDRLMQGAAVGAEGGAAESRTSGPAVDPGRLIITG